MFTVSTELAWMLRTVGRDRDPRPGVRTPGLHATLLELRSWVDDPRPYDKQHHKAPWKTVAADASEVLDTVGEGLRALAPSLGAVASLVLDTELGASPTWRDQCRAALVAAADELTSPSAAVAALDDLHAAMLDPATPYDVAERRTLHLDGVLRFGGRTLNTEGERLAGILLDEATSVDTAHAIIAGDPDPAIRGPNERAELTEPERFALCRELLQHRLPRGTQVVWLCFENAHCRFPNWILPIGGVTFINGPTLVPVLDDIATGTLPPHLRGSLPGELLDDVASLRWQLDVAKHNEGLKEWVWARVDLGDEPYVSPLAQARRIATSLVDLAAFHDNGTHWRLMDGALLLVDGRVRLGGLFNRSVAASEFARHFTSETLGELADELAPHVPSIAEPLLELLAAARTVQGNTAEHSSTALLIDVQVIELIATMTGTPLWHKHLRSDLAGTWARTVLLDELIDAYLPPTGEFELRELPEVEAIGGLYEHVTDDRIDRLRLRYDLALHRLPAICAALPVHAPGARRLRTLNDRLSSTTSAGQWIDDLVSQYGAAVDRLARCRNSIAHAGPTNREVVESVRRFGNDQAGRVTSMAIWATVRGQSLRAAHDQPRDRDARWRAALDEPGATTDALLDTSA